MGACIGQKSKLHKMKGLQIQIEANRIILQQKIAEGAYGDIWKCKSSANSKIYAAKQIKLQNSELFKMYEKQVKWLKKLASTEGVVAYVGSCVLKEEGNNEEISPRGIILTEFYEISLFDQIKNQKMTATQILEIGRQILNTLKSIHEAGCGHLDIKPENILYQVKNAKYRICDFGSCLEIPVDIKKMDKKQKNCLREYIQANCTLIYRSPEMISLSDTITGKSDIWMLGCVLYLLLFRKHPFEGQGQLAILTGNIDYTLPDNQQEESLLLIESIKNMLVVDPEKRLDQYQILKIIDDIEDTHY